MIQDARAFRSETLPDEMHHREGKVQQLTNALQGITRGNPGIDSLVTGPSGAGKTTTARYVLNKLEPEAIHFKWGIVNCISHSSPSEALSTALQDAGIASENPKGTPPGHYVQQFRDFCEHQFVIVLDEIDVLSDPSILTALEEVENVTTILITLDEDEWMAELDKRIASRVRSMHHVPLTKYHHDEMADILRSRADLGLRIPVTEGAIHEMADIAAGDARYGISLLQNAALLLPVRKDRLEAEDVDEEVKRSAKEDIADRHRADLSTHQRALYDLICEYGPLGTDELERRYQATVSDPRSWSRCRDFLSSLKKYEMIVSEGSGRAGATYRRGTY